MPAHILLIDDDASLAEAIKAVLESRGHTVTYFDDGEVAIAAAEKGEFHLVLTDYRMPGMGGMPGLPGGLPGLGKKD